MQHLSFFLNPPYFQKSIQPHQAFFPSYPPQSFFQVFIFNFSPKKKKIKRLSLSVSLSPPSVSLLQIKSEILDSHPTKFKDRSCDDELSATKEWSPMKEIEGLDFKQRRKKVSYHPFYKDKLKEISDHPFYKDKLKEISDR